MADNNFKGTVEALFTGIDGVVSSKTVVGDAIHIGDTIILPLVDVSFAIGAGAFNADKKEKGAGGVGGKMTPCAVLVIQNGHTRLVNIKNQDTITSPIAIPNSANPTTRFIFYRPFSYNVSYSILCFTQTGHYR